MEVIACGLRLALHGPYPDLHAGVGDWILGVLQHLQRCIDRIQSDGMPFCIVGNQISINLVLLAVAIRHFFNQQEHCILCRKTCEAE
jgi:hypothetical protein